MEHTFCLISPSRSFKLTLLNLNQPCFLSSSFAIQTQKRRIPTISSRSRRRRFVSQGWRKKLILGVFDLVSSNLEMFPEPLTLAIREFVAGGGGGGGGRGFWKRLGGGDSDGWRRKKNVNLRFIWLAILVLGGSGVWLILDRGTETDVVLGVGFLALCLVCVAMRGWNEGLKDWIFGFFSCAILVTIGLGLKRDDLMRRMQSFRLMESAQRGRTRRRRAF